MTTPRVINFGHRYNYFNRISVSAATFAVAPDVLLSFKGTPSISLINEVTGIIQYSFNGSDIDGDMVPGTPSAQMVFNRRGYSQIWFKLASGATSNIRVEATADGDILITGGGGGSTSGGGTGTVVLGQPAGITGPVLIATGTMPGAMGLTDAISTPTTTVIGALEYNYNGSVWNRNIGGVLGPSGPGAATGMLNVIPVAQYQGAGAVTVASGQISPLQVDSLGNLQANLYSKLAGEDLVNDVMKISQENTYTNIVGATSSFSIKASAGVLNSVIFNTAAPSAVLVLYDNTSAAGTQIASIGIPGVVGPAPIAIQYGVKFNTGLFVGLPTGFSGPVNVTISSI